MNDQTNQPLVSIIVPFYNVEQYVNYCCNSLLKQTYTNYELILIDDGSEDQTGNLLDSFSDIDNISIFHNRNQGLSASRNFGVKVCHGDYVSFVDGDDIVSPYYLEELISPLKNTPADNVLVTSVPELIKSDAICNFNWNNLLSRKWKEIDKSNAALALMYDEMKTSACGYLASRKVYLENPFPVGRFYEEASTICDFINAVDRIVVIESKIYGYVMRSESIVHESHPSHKQVDDYIVALQKLIPELRELCQEDCDHGITYHECLQLSRIFMLIQKAAKEDDYYARLMQDITKEIRAKAAIWKNDKRASRPAKIRFLLLAYLPSLYPTIFRLYEKYIRA